MVGRDGRGLGVEPDRSEGCGSAAEAGVGG